MKGNGEKACFSIPHMVFRRLDLLTFPIQALVFTYLQHTPFENTVGKEEIARNEQFLLSPQCFLPFLGTFHHIHDTYNCRLQALSLWKSLQFVVWERAKERDCV